MYGNLMLMSAAKHRSWAPGNFSVKILHNQDTDGYVYQAHDYHNNQ